MKIRYGIITLLGLSSLAYSCSKSEILNTPIEESTKDKTANTILLSRLDELIDKKEEKIKQSDFNFYSINDQDLVNLYDNLLLKKDKNKLYLKLAFEIKDEIIRRSSIAYSNNESEKLNLFSKLDFIKSIDFSKENFLHLVCDNCKGSEFLEKSYIKSDNLKEPVKNDHYIRVVLGAFEAPNARLGGIGEYIYGILNAELDSLKNSAASDKIDAALVSPFYDILKSQYLNKVTFVGFLPHYLDGKIYKSTIYKLIEKDLIQYLVQPDPTFSFTNTKGNILSGWDIFDIVNQSKVYSVFGNNVGWLYYTGALTSFATFFKGESGNEFFDVLHINSKIISIANPLQLKLNDKRAAVSLAKVGVLSTIHDNHPGNTGDLKPFERLGLEKPLKTNKYNRVSLAVETSHMVNFVSKTTESEVTNPSFWPSTEKDISKAFKIAKSQGRFVGINNGIFFKNFDITSTEILGNQVVAKDYSNYEMRKKETKKILFDNGIIGSPTLPLFVYVGRFADNKGIDVLAEFAKDIVTNHHGQVVVMGTTGGKLPPEILAVQDVAKDLKFKGLIKFYKDFDKDQLAILPSVGASKGRLIRFASDFTLVPSKLEAAGLVPAEGLSLGSATISSYREGLIDQCTNPFGKGFDIHNFTCIPFEVDLKSTSSTIFNLKSSVNDALTQWNSLSEVEKIIVQKKLITNAKTFDWNAPGGSFEQYVKLFKKTIKEANN
ncbi:glycosyltransferase [Silvanigrella aquatica]|uniref:Glycosyl transferase family 1 domain-containing protein n=1 Tax=Silvanigrella aquatica TaxID=1915309 RepID=A0A1L4D2N8_9BACT|nr:glycosyltransferase [Silvanigrella aquatica]APJ04468.1 hypothetical protein AXG55_11330 [Silvanigrella aquatica]